MSDYFKLFQSTMDVLSNSFAERQSYSRLDKITNYLKSWFKNSWEDKFHLNLYNVLKKYQHPNFEIVLNLDYKTKSKVKGRCACYFMSDNKVKIPTLTFYINNLISNKLNPRHHELCAFAFCVVHEMSHYNQFNKMQKAMNDTTQLVYCDYISDPSEVHANAVETAVLMIYLGIHISDLLPFLKKHDFYYEMFKNKKISQKVFNKYIKQVYKQYNDIAYPTS